MPLGEDWRNHVVALCPQGVPRIRGFSWFSRAWKTVRPSDTSGRIIHVLQQERLLSKVLILRPQHPNVCAGVFLDVVALCGPSAWMALIGSRVGSFQPSIRLRNPDVVKQKRPHTSRNTIGGVVVSLLTWCVCVRAICSQGTPYAVCW